MLAPFALGRRDWVDRWSARSRLAAGSQVTIRALFVVAEHLVMAPQPFRLMARVVGAVPCVVRHAVVSVLATGPWLGRGWAVAGL